MTKQEKKLLLRDLCSRIPYDTRVRTPVSPEVYLRSVDTFGYSVEVADYNECVFDIEEVRPYLRPIKSMTEKEVDTLFKILKVNEENGKEWIKVNDIGIIRLFTEEGKDFYEIAEAMDYLNLIYIDYRGLIHKNLALEAPEEMYK